MLRKFLKYGLMAALWFSQVGFGETFDQVASLALENEPRIGAAIAAAEAEEERVRQAVAEGRLQVTSTIFTEGSREAGTSIARIELSQELYSFGRRALSIEAAQQRVDLNWLEVIRTRQDVFSDVAIAYVNILQADELIALRQNFLDELESRSDGVLERVSAGLSSIVEFQALGRRLAEAEVNVLLAEQEATTARLELERLAGIYIAETSGNDLQSYLNLLPNSLDRIARLADTTSPENLISAQRLRIVEADVAAQNRANAPNIETYSTFDYGQGPSGDIERSNAGIRLTVPLYQGGRRGAVAAEGQKTIAEAKKLREQDRLLIQQSIEEAWLSVEIAIRTADVWYRSLTIQREQENAVQNEIDADLASIDALLDVQTELVETQVLQIRARFDIIRSQLVLLRTIGLANFGDAALETTGGEM